MMIHRKITERVETLAGFLIWDPDPYLVLGQDGRLVWIVDGYMTSDAHPYSRSIEFEGMRAVQLHPQLGEGHRRRLRRHGSLLRIRSGRSADQRLPRICFPNCSSPPPRCRRICARTRAIRK